MRLWLVRHGATVNNAEARFTGQTDIGLSETGRFQVELLAARLEEMSFDAIVSSDLKRAQQTAIPIATACKETVIWDRRMREIAMGEWEGRTLHDVRSSDPERFERWQSMPADNPPPGGESLRDVLARVAAAFESCYSRFPDGDVLWVTHGGVLSILAAHVLGLDLNRGVRLRRDNTSLSQISISEAGMQIVLWNDTRHLTENTLQIEKRQVM